MEKWEPTIYTDDPAANAIYNVAAELSACSEAIGWVLYGLKYGKDEGMSVAEAIEVGLKGIAESVAMSSGSPTESLGDIREKIP